MWNLTKTGIWPQTEAVLAEAEAAGPGQANGEDLAHPGQQAGQLAPPLCNSGEDKLATNNGQSKQRESKVVLGSIWLGEISDVHIILSSVNLSH